jgi:capsular exopolysaccharide synthesis family protein
LAESGLDALQMHVDPDAVESEAFRTLRTAIAFSRPETGRIVVSSTEPGDGKTTVLSNLAVAYARAGKRTLMIDADMRRPGLSRLLELRGEDGLTQVLQGTGNVAELAQRYTRNCGVEGLDVLPSGPRQINPAELLAGPRLAELLSWAESTYDQILIDAPPAGAAADASMIAANTDGLVLVVRPDKNRRQSVVRAIEGFRGIGIEPLGIVVNGLIADGDKGYYAYAEGYNYGYGEEAGSEWNEPDQVPRRARNADVPHVVDIESRPSHEESPAATAAEPPIVPRRAA